MRNYSTCEICGALTMTYARRWCGRRECKLAVRTVDVVRSRLATCRKAVRASIGDDPARLWQIERDLFGSTVVSPLEPEETPAPALPKVDEATEWVLRKMAETGMCLCAEPTRFPGARCPAHPEKERPIEAGFEGVPRMDAVGGVGGS